MNQRPRIYEIPALTAELSPHGTLTTIRTWNFSLEVKCDVPFTMSAKMRPFKVAANLYSISKEVLKISLH